MSIDIPGSGSRNYSKPIDSRGNSYEKGGDVIEGPSSPDNTRGSDVDDGPAGATTKGGDVIGPEVDYDPKEDEKRKDAIARELYQLIYGIRNPNNGNQRLGSEFGDQTNINFSQIEQELENEMASEVGSSSEDVDASNNTDRQERSKQMSTQANKAALDIDADAIRNEIQTIDNVPITDSQMPDEADMSAQVTETLVSVKDSFGAADELPLLKSAAEYTMAAFSQNSRADYSLITPASIRQDADQQSAMSGMTIDDDGKQVNVLVLGAEFGQMPNDERMVNLIYYVQKWKHYDILGKSARAETGENSKVLLETSANLAMLEAYVKLKQLNPNLNLKKCEEMLESVKEDGINGLKEYSRKALEFTTQSAAGSSSQEDEQIDSE